LITYFPSLFCIFWPHYIAAKEALLVLVLGQGFVLSFGSAPCLFKHDWWQRIFQRIVLVALGLNFILNYWLIPSYGMIGVGNRLFRSSHFFGILEQLLCITKTGLLF
jgi:hypothetical protein